jgi:hypothetical protein
MARHTPERLTKTYMVPGMQVNNISAKKKKKSARKQTPG